MSEIDDENFIQGMKFRGYNYSELIKIIHYFKSNDMDPFILDIRRLENEIQELKRKDLK